MAYLDKVFDSIIQGTDDLGNYYAISLAFDDLKTIGKVRPTIMTYTKKYIDILDTMANTTEPSIHIHVQLFQYLKDYINRVTELIKIYRLNPDITYFGYAKEARAYYYDTIMCNYVDTLLMQMDQTKSVPYEQIPELIVQLSSIIAFRDHYSPDTKKTCQALIQKMLQNNLTVDNLLRYHHFNTKVTHDLAKIFNGLDLGLVEKHYVKYLQTRLLSGTNTDKELAVNKKLLKSKRIGAMINDTIKSRIIRSKLPDSICRPHILNRKLWDIVNVMPFRYPESVQCILNATANSIEERHAEHKVNWCNGLGHAKIRIQDCEITCNMYQLSALCLIKDGSMDAYGFAEVTGCSNKFADLVIGSLISAGLVTETGDMNPYFYPKAMDLNEIFVKLMSRS